MAMFVPTYQGLSPADFMRAPAVAPTPFPFNAPASLPFYRARNAIYHLFCALRAQRKNLTVIAPDYNSGNEILALRAAGATIHYAHVDRQMHLDPAEIERLCQQHDPDVLYVIHYLGWPQPMTPLVEICRRREMLMVEDCALALLSEPDGRALGTYGDWSVFCLYKTLPVPNGALLVQNTERIDSLGRLQLRRAGAASVAGRTLELIVQRTRGRANGIGAALDGVKRGLGRLATALDVRRAAVGDMGFDLDDTSLAMSSVSDRLISRLDFPAIVRRRVENYARMAHALDATAREGTALEGTALEGAVSQVFQAPDNGICPLFFPILVDDKHTAALALRNRGVDALEFWNEGADSGSEMGPDARFLRRHVLELPIHQDLSARHIDYTARAVSGMSRVV
jgi:dTDP-4-amino-4,6-dideoxygalactose transaminase